MKNKKLLIGFLFFGAVTMLIMSFHYFVGEDSGILKGKAIKDSSWYRLSFYTHISFGLIAILIGPFQLIDKLIRQQPKFHKGLGYLYSLAVASTSLTGLIIAQFAMGGIITNIGFSTLSCLWFFSLLIALKKVFAGNIRGHQIWMKINYALTFSSITQRLILLFAFVPSFSFIGVYQVSSWLSWMFNLGLILFFLRRNRFIV